MVSSLDISPPHFSMHSHCLPCTKLTPAISFEYNYAIAESIHFKIPSTQLIPFCYRSHFKQYKPHQGLVLTHSESAIFSLTVHDIKFHIQINLAERVLYTYLNFRILERRLISKEF
jgi:hypothetical protein